MISSRPAHAAKRCIDSCLFGLLPWLASRFDLSEGAFRGEGAEGDASPALRSAQGRAILQTLGIHALLPHIVRVKLERWPALDEARLREPSDNSPLSRAARVSARSSAEDFESALRPYLSPDLGYDLHPFSGAPGSLAAAYHLLVVVRPRWFAARARPLPGVPSEEIAALNERLLTPPGP